MNSIHWFGKPPMPDTAENCDDAGSSGTALLPPLDPAACYAMVHHAASSGYPLLGANEMSGSVARNVSGFGVRHGAILKPGTLVTGNPEDEIRRDIHGLAGEASDASRGSAVTGGM